MVVEEVDRDDESMLAQDEAQIPEDVPQNQEDESQPEEDGQQIEEEDGCFQEDDSEGHVSHNRELGKRGEDAVARYLEKRGLEIIERNWVCRYGEVDIIALDDDEVVFVEVKTRRGVDKGIPEDAVDAKKRERYEKIAASYLVDHDFPDCYLRFDVIGVLVIDDTVGHGRAIVRHHRSAFSRAS